MSNCFWWITVEVERHVDADAARALEAELQGLAFVLNCAPGRAPMTLEKDVREVVGTGWSARFGTDMALPDDLIRAAHARLERLADIFEIGVDSQESLS